MFEFEFEFSNANLSKQERGVFRKALEFCEVEENVWEVYDALFESATDRTKPLLLKVYENSELCAVTVIIHCTKYGKSLFRNPLLAGLLDRLRIPMNLWIKVGCCMDMMSCPGFVRDPARSQEMQVEMARFLGSTNMITVIMDDAANAFLYPQATVLPSLPHALIDTSDMSDIADFLGNYKNIKRKLRKFENKGGTYHLAQDQLPESEIPHLEECFLSTAEISVMYMPYQDLYLNAAKVTGRTEVPDIFYFIARLNGEFIGYQAAVKTGKHLNGLHGAFDRRRATTYHAYSILFVKMVEFALEHDLKMIDLGVVLNETKKRMVNKTNQLANYLLSKSALFKWVLSGLLRFTRMQGKEQMQYLDVDK